MKVRLLLGVVTLMLAPAVMLAQVSDPAAAICLSVLKLDMKDTNSVLSDQYHFSQFQDILRSANFSSYQQYSSSGAGLGIDIPIGDALIGFSGDYKTDAGTFQQQMNQFLSSNYSQVLEHSTYIAQSAVLNRQVLAVAQDCQDKYFDRLKDRVQLSVSVEPENYAKFVVKLVGNVPTLLAGHGVTFEIQQIEPAGDVSCTEGGNPVALNKTRPDGQAIMTCVKEENKDVPFAVRTTLGISQPLTLPGKPAPQLPPPASTPVSVVWTDAPALSPVTVIGPEGLPAVCPCCSVVPSPGQR